jgi:hypothetical protein
LQPGKLRIQGGDRFGGGFQGRNGTLDGLQRSAPLGAQASAVAAVSSSAARSNATQILGGLVEQDVGVVGHSVSRHDHSSLQPRQLSSPKCGVGADSIDEKAMVPVACWVVAERRMKAAPLQRVIEFPKRPAAEDVVSERIIFEVGNTRFAINWTAEIEQLPPAGPVAIERKRPNSNRSSQVRR